jgi:Glycosyl hydrolase family 26
MRARPLGRTLAALLVLGASGSFVASSTNAGRDTTQSDAPTIVTAPTIAGTTTAGQTVTASKGTWSGNPTTYRYQWKRCTSSGGSCQRIAGATAANYALGAADVGLTIKVVVTAENSFGSTSAASAPTSVVGIVPTVTPLPANPSAARLLGVNLPWSSSWLSDLDQYARLVGRVPSIVMTYRDFTIPMLSLTQMSDVAAHGSLPMVTVEPWDSSSATDPRYSLRKIVRGDFDSWFAAGANTAVTYGRVLYLRFAPEMNGVWAPWGAGINGNTPLDYIVAWRHVHAIFVGRGAKNVKWVWAPNIFGGGAALDFTPYYPGSDVVDVLALDGYNWGSLDVWQTYSQVFGPSYDSLSKLDTVKPVMITETASAESGGDKGAWITSAFTREIPSRTPRVKAVIWFSVKKEVDWRVNSSERSLAAYRAVAMSSAWG